MLLDVIDPAVGKAEALDFLQARWGIAAAETLAIGDNWNDREMVARAGIGFVMANADPELLALGMPVLPSNDEDGVALAIEEHVLSASESASARGELGPARRARQKNGGRDRSRPPQLPRGSYFFFFAAFFLAAFFFAGIEVIPPFSPDLDKQGPLSTYRVSRGFAY